jgi:hypothetical protein
MATQMVCVIRVAKAKAQACELTATTARPLSAG